MRSSGVVLVGPYPPPHGGVSVHVRQLREQLREAGIRAEVINASPDAPPSEDYVSIDGALGLVREVALRARRGWVVHVHINGHNAKSWLLALACGVAGRAAPRRMLTVHSGMAPEYVGGGWGTLLARAACTLYENIVCVSAHIRAALNGLGVGDDRLEVMPAYLPPSTETVELTGELSAWMNDRRPLLCTTLAFEPEYRFDLLVAAMEELRRRHGDVGCIVMGGGSGREEALELVRSRELDDAMLLLGDVDHDMCLRIIADADLYLRTTDRDGDSITVREALALGTPVVASAVGHRPARTVLFPPGDLEGLLDAVRQTLSPRPRIEVELGRMEEATPTLATLYRAP